MKNGFGRFALIGALLAAFAAAFAHLNYLNSLEKKSLVVVAKKEIPAFQMLDESNLAVVEMPASAVGQTAVTRIQDAKGQYARGVLVPGQMLQKGHLMPAPGGAMAARLTAAGEPEFRAMAIRVTPESSVANTIQPGDHVDILVSMKADGTQGRSAVSKIIAEGVQVLHTSFGQASTATQANEGTVVLQVPPDMAEEIAFAQANGTITLLTTPFSSRPGGTTGVSLDSFLQKMGAAVADNRQKGSSK